MPDPIEIQTDRMRRRFVGRTVDMLDRACASLESPIEKALFWALVEFADYMEWAGESGPAWSGPNPHAPGATEFGRFAVHVSRERFKFVFIPQLSVAVEGRRYRLDFALLAQGTNPKWAASGDEKPYCIVPIAIECDGHDFHERTKEQAARDKRRDQDLQAIGWNVARYTGSEIFHDPAGVANRVFDFATSLLRLKGAE